LKKTLLKQRLEKFFEETDFDVSGIPSSTVINEAYLAKIATKIAVGLATVYWSSLELRDFYRLRKSLLRKAYPDEF
jgi:hypothetical protein